MKKSYLLLLLILIGFSSCYQGYYTGETSEDFQIYTSTENTNNPIITIPAGSSILFKKKGKYRYVACESYSGYTRRIKFQKYRKQRYSESELLSYTKINKDEYKNTSRTNSSTDEKSTYQGGRVNVKGYYRKDGTYVRPHTRSAPGSGKSYRSSGGRRR